MHVRQYAIAVSVIVLIWLMMPGRDRKVVSTAPGLAGTFNPLGGTQAEAAMAAPKVGLNVMGPPTISVAQIEQVLREYNSPAMGQGQQMYDLGVKYGINPAIALAFFIKESSAGSNPSWAGRKPDGSYTHNVGNIICAGFSSCYKGHRDYPSWEAGIEAWYRLILHEYVEARGVPTVEEIIPIYCPASDGCSPNQYIDGVNKMVKEWEQQYSS